MKRREFLANVAAGLAAATLLPGIAPRAWAQGAVAAGAAGAGRKPNILVIVADDQGYHELGCYGNTDIPTPNIDALARGGIRFTDGYVSCPVCSPTRAGLLTGRYQQRFGHELNPGPAQAADPSFGLALDEATLAERLKKLGYATGMFGKWHEGYQPQFHPLKRGFDEYYGFLGGAHSYLDAKEDSANPILDGEKPVTDINYTTDEFARRAADFIVRKKDIPFFVYLPFNAVHAPLQSLQKYLDRFTAIQDEKRRTFAAMLSALDDGVGTVVGKLRELGLEEKTLIIFISDNGGPTRQTTSGNAPLRGFKAQVLEGGIRIPYIIHWKGQLPEGKTYSKPVISLDIHPTALAVAGGALEDGAKPLDGVNLIPFLKGEASGAPHDRLFWRYGAQSAARLGDWKLVNQPGAEGQLYNLAEDIGESKNLAAEKPEKLKELQTAYKEWEAQMIPPRWQGRRAALAAQGAGEEGSGGAQGAQGGKKKGKKKAGQGGQGKKGKKKKQVG